MDGRCLNNFCSCEGVAEEKPALLNDKTTAFERWFYCPEKIADRKRRTVETPTLGSMVGGEYGK